MSGDGKTLGRLWLVPTLIAPGPPEEALPAATLAAVRGTRDFVVEGEKAAWRLLSALLDREALAGVHLGRLDEHSPTSALPGLIAPALEGRDLALLSEAGVPCVADPGAPLVALAHDLGIRVVPLPGPSSIILALSASGLDGQRFSFLGYLPAEREGRRAALRGIDRGVRTDGFTRIFIETPYRNDHLLADCLETLSPSTRLCVARGIGSPEELIKSATVEAWKASGVAVGKVPSIFLVGATPGLSLDPKGGLHNSPRHSSRQGSHERRHKPG